MSMIGTGGWQSHNIWQHSASVRDLYARRCNLQAEEMTCHAQATNLLRPHVAPGDSLLDAGCGSGYFFHSLRRREIDVEYYGIDATQCLIEIGREHLPRHGLPPDRLQVLRIEDLDASVDHVVCINVLSNIDNFHRPFERLLKAAHKTVILRESASDTSSYTYVRDTFLDEGIDLHVHVNTYAVQDIKDFALARGFTAAVVEDERTHGNAEFVIGYPHHWKFFVCTRVAGRGTNL